MSGGCLIWLVCMFCSFGWKNLRYCCVRVVRLSLRFVGSVCVWCWMWCMDSCICVWFVLNVCLVR